MAKQTKAKPQKSLETALFTAADKLRKNIDAAEYKHIVLGLVFLKFISDSFQKLYDELVSEDEDVEYEDFYIAKNIFFIPQNARWQDLIKKAKTPSIGKDLDYALELIEKQNESLKGVLPKVYAKENLDSATLGDLMNLIDSISLKEANTSDILGHVFEYFLGEFALAEGKKGGQFYTPKSVVELLVSMLEPYKGRVFDPCCGSGGMFVQSEEFIKEHQGKINDISIFGQESNQTTWRLAKMNLAMRKIDSSQVKWNSEGSFLNNAHKGLKVDFIIANPPFNDSDYFNESLANDARFSFGTPPSSNANYAWIQHFIHHLAPNGRAGFVLAKGSLTSNTNSEGEIRKKIIEANLVECIVNLPAKLFLNTQIPACLWFLRRGKTHTNTLFIDARNLGTLINRKNKILTNEDIKLISNTYHKWQKAQENGNSSLRGGATDEAIQETNNYEDTKGFCKSASLEEIRALEYILTPGRFVGLADNDEEFDFESEFTRLNTELREQLKQEEILNKQILASLDMIGGGIK
ncbi:DNA methyltransferase [Campylobacter sp. MIT 12-5580]|uniref:type I restriction-modification system subunit M n=1 Tax=Campylobacter sp. MIT 12-5580 TaxID=2040651 RepID=UPI0010F828D1|nr:class I SAM-dependent DNA methyltransferase [Campylobacter sp. MIT 12-5580]TKX29062.1 DNA methyltransferase [Campylobacter sp. MIT 12-5580]